MKYINICPLSDLNNVGNIYFEFFQQIKFLFDALNALVLNNL